MASLSVLFDVLETKGLIDAANLNQAQLGDSKGSTINVEDCLSFAFSIILSRARSYFSDSIIDGLGRSSTVSCSWIFFLGSLPLVRYCEARWSYCSSPEYVDRKLQRVFSSYRLFEPRRPGW